MRPTSLSPEFYTNLFDEITSLEEDYNTRYTGEKAIIDFNVEVNGIIVWGNASFSLEYVDDSFDHAFGTQEGYHYELDELADIKIDRVFIQDEEGREPDIELTCLFDNAAFWAQAQR